VQSSISIIIATSGQVEKLRRLLDSLCRLKGGEKIDHEVIIANNAANETTATAVEGLVREYADHGTLRCRQVRELMPGKCRAQNKAIPQAVYPILAFLDDDVEVHPVWLRFLAGFFATYPHDVMQGSILMRDEDRNDPEIQRLYKRYRTIDFIDYGFASGTEIHTLTGGNMAIRREVFDQVGMFDERLGPGQSGISEDVEFAERVLKAGKRIGYEPRASVYNEIDWSRLNEEFFRLRHERRGRSRLIYKGNSLLSIIPNLTLSVWTFAWYSLARNERSKYRSKGRYYHYRVMFREKTKRVKKAKP